MTVLVTRTAIVTVDEPTDPHLDGIVELLRQSIPAECAGLTPVHAANFSAYLAAAVSPPRSLRTVMLRCVRDSSGVRAVADWRVLGGRLFLNGIAVAADQRGRGWGGLLLDDGCDLARRLGCTELALDVSVRNPGARRLYERRGFADETYAQWTEVTPDGSAPNPHVRLLDWPSFVAHHSAYGFGDLRVRSEAGATSVRVVGAALRLPAEVTGPGLAAALTEVVPATRCYRIRTVSGAGTTGGFAHFARMSRPVDRQV
ncbi:ribosomal protein S18 acetylase RimI-like enzyme [Micromonospora luteifusca]|uniref:Ribosomal protein S18 acetylase RimI-like enzyme n=1 Tax=Micromonospora luteifusca TaxID=709860 RepID=A0ABS2LZM3_9ACTN|nr:GNAT family N-acetyltransferase [Micromonospora luteifusca]MBM7493647.1 ribosomal protein S18 acetylase RimI-like enzyme [Micromonospora luteifusca]